MSLADTRRDYQLHTLNESDIPATPHPLFDDWIAQALKSDAPDRTAMTLATATPDGKPSARTVLLKGADERGLVFYTNYASRKGQEIDANPNAAILFFWPDLERQIRATGVIEKTSAEDSDAYFATRPRESNLSAIASPQSQVVTSRDELETKVAQVDARYPDQPLPRPEYWGGYRFVPDSFEFWQGGAARTHDRLRYTRQEDGTWAIERLAP